MKNKWGREIEETMKKLIVISLIISIFIIVGCGDKEEVEIVTETGNQLVEESETSTKTEANTGQSDLSELEAIGEIEVEKELFDVILTIPAEYIGEATQEELDIMANDAGYESISLNEDGSATYVMTKRQHKELLETMSDSIQSTLQSMIASEEYPNITSVETNDNFTQFTITTTSTELSLAESFSVMGFYMYGGMYSIFEGTDIENISVTFINANSGEIITTANSSDYQ